MTTNPEADFGMPRLVDISTLAGILGTSIRHIRRLVADTRIPYIKVGHYVRFDPDEIRAWVNAARVPPKREPVSDSPTIITPRIGDHRRPRGIGL